MKYEHVILGDMVTFQKGFVFKSKDFTNYGIPVVKVSNFIGDTVDMSSCEMLPNSFYETNKKYSLEEDEILIATVGSWPTNPNSVVGRVVRVPKLKKVALLNQNIVKITSNSDLLNNDFLYYLLKSKTFKDYLVSTAQGSANQASVTLESIKKFNFELPPIDSQYKIAHFLKMIDKKIKTNKQIINSLEPLSQTLFKHWFIDFEFPNEQGQPYKSSGGEMMESELGEIPEEWKVGTASNLFDFSPTEKLSKGALVKYVEMKDLQNSAMIYQYTDREFKSGSKFRNGDTLLARITPCLENGKIGFVDFLDKNEVAWGSTEFIVIRTKPEISKTFSYFFAADSAFKDYAIINMNGSSGRQRVKAATLAQYKVAIPPLQLIKQFTDIADANMRMMTNLKLQINKLEQLRDTLLPKLLSGEIEIPDELEV